MKIPFELDRHSDIPLVEQLTSGLKTAILSGVWKAGDVLPSSRELVKLTGASRIITSAALANLKKDGFVSSRPRIGSVVLGRDERVWKGHVQIVLTDHAGSYYPNVFSDELSLRLSSSGYILTKLAIPSVLEGDPDFAPLEVAFARPTDLTVVLFYYPPVVKFLKRRNVPFVTVARKEVPGARGVGHIMFDRLGAMPDFISHCQDSGVRNVLIINTPETQTVASESMLRKGGIHAESWLIPRSSDYGRPEGASRSALDEFRRRLRSGRDWVPDVLLFADDHAATGALVALAEAGVRIPEDVRVVTWENRGNGCIAGCTLTAMQVDPRAQAVTVADYLLSLLRTHTKVENVRLNPVYVRRESFP